MQSPAGDHEIIRWSRLQSFGRPGSICWVPTEYNTKPGYCHCRYSNVLLPYASMSAVVHPIREKLGLSTPSTSFSIEPVWRFRGPCAVAEEPIEITCFSYDKQRNLHHDTSSMVDPKSFSD